MWIKLDVDGIDFHFRVSRYRKSTKENWYDEWCSVELALQADNFIDCHMGPCENMLAKEVEELRDEIDALLNDKLDEPYKIQCIEPRFEFHLFPKKDKRKSNVIDCEKFDYIFDNVFMEFIVTFWGANGGISDNRLLLAFERELLEKLLCYLNFVTGITDKEDGNVKKALSEGYIYGQL